MNVKQYVSLGVLIVGVALLICGFYGTSRMSSARADIDRATGYVPKNPARDVASNLLHGEVDKHQNTVTLCYVGGVVFTVAGVLGLYFFRKKKR